MISDLTLSVEDDDEGRIGALNRWTREVRASFAALSAGAPPATRRVASDFAAVPDETVFVDTTAAARNASLPPPTGQAGARVTIAVVVASANGVTVRCPSFLIDGAASYALAGNFSSATFCSDGLNWLSIAQA